MNNEKFPLRYEAIWRKTLNDNENVEYEFSVSKKYKIIVLSVWLFLALIGLATSVWVFLAFALCGAIHYWILGINAYAFTSKRILIHTGWLSTKSTSIMYDKVVEVSVQEPFLSRTFTGSGSLAIKTAGLGHDILLNSIAKPYEVKKVLDRISHQS